MPSFCASQESHLATTSRNTNGVIYSINLIHIRIETSTDETKVSLNVADIRDVEWNENAFELLVLEPATKELVEAVVTHRILGDKHTDVIQGKGNGLFILLHGQVKVNFFRQTLLTKF